MQKVQHALGLPFPTKSGRKISCVIGLTFTCGRYTLKFNLPKWGREEWVWSWCATVHWFCLMWKQSFCKLTMKMIVTLQSYKQYMGGNDLYCQHMKGLEWDIKPANHLCFLFWHRGINEPPKWWWHSETRLWMSWRSCRTIQRRLNAWHWSLMRLEYIRMHQKDWAGMGGGA